MTLAERIVALHVVYHMNESQVLWFGQLVFHTPGILFHLTDEMIANSSEMVHISHNQGVCTDRDGVMKLEPGVNDITEFSLKSVRTNKTSFLIFVQS